MPMLQSLNNYSRLIRFDKPVGTLLLWFPTADALWIVARGTPEYLLVWLFFAGTFIMRSAGCIVNDLADRNIDGFVARTQRRPLALGTVSIPEALMLLGLLLLAALYIVLQLPYICFYYALIALLITFIYPFCKRFIKAPQLVLGLAFSMGIPLAGAAQQRAFDSALMLLFGINFLWILFYDTIYALADLPDDLKIGVNSLAIFFGRHYKRWLTLLQVGMHGLWLCLGMMLELNYLFYCGWIIGVFLLAQQQKFMQIGNVKLVLRAFSGNAWYGLVMWMALVISLR